MPCSVSQEGVSSGKSITNSASQDKILSTTLDREHPSLGAFVLLFAWEEARVGHAAEPGQVLARWAPSVMHKLATTLEVESRHPHNAHFSPTSPSLELLSN